MTVLEYWYEELVVMFWQHHYKENIFQFKRFDSEDGSVDLMVELNHHVTKTLH